MEDFTPILKNISRFIQLTPEEEELFLSHVQIKRVKKKQYLVQPGFVCKHRYFTLNGALRAYLRCNDGQEFTIGLAIEDWWIADYSSFINQEPATQFVEAVEDSVVIQLSYEDEQQLYEKIPKFERFFRISCQRGGAAIQKRMIMNLGKSAESRYEDLVKNHPLFIQKFPQYIIASYLGMTTQFLSKIRNRKTKVNPV